MELSLSPWDIPYFQPEKKEEAPHLLCQLVCFDLDNLEMLQSPDNAKNSKGMDREKGLGCQGPIMDYDITRYLQILEVMA